MVSRETNPLIHLCDVSRADLVTLCWKALFRILPNYLKYIRYGPKRPRQIPLTGLSFRADSINVSTGVDSCSRALDPAYI